MGRRWKNTSSPLTHFWLTMNLFYFQGFFLLVESCGPATVLLKGPCGESPPKPSSTHRAVSLKPGAGWYWQRPRWPGSFHSSTTNCLEENGVYFGELSISNIGTEAQMETKKVESVRRWPKWSKRWPKLLTLLVLKCPVWERLFVKTQGRSSECFYCCQKNSDLLGTSPAWRRREKKRVFPAHKYRGRIFHNSSDLCDR